MIRRALLAAVLFPCALACGGTTGDHSRPGTGGANGADGGTGGADGGMDAVVNCPEVQPPASSGPWHGIVGTGQSLATGDLPVTSTTQPYNNLKLSLGTLAAIPPFNPEACGLIMVPLTEPIRLMGSGFPRAYPGNIWGETPHSAMANQITALVKALDPTADYMTVHTVVGESGQGIVALKKQASGASTTGDIGRAYAATLFEAAAITRLARAAGGSYSIGAVVMTHGETDSGSGLYQNELIQLLNDYNTDLAAITGQTQRFPMFLSQQFAYPNTEGGRPFANQVQWRLGVERPTDFVCTGPKYQYPGNGDGVHLSAAGYRQLGEKNGQIYHERIVLGHDWRPLEPTTYERSGRVITVHFHVPVPPLAWDETLDAATAWVNGRGFEVRAGGTKIEIASVEIVGGDTVQITCASDLPAAGVIVGYAAAAAAAKMNTASRAFRWGQLRDSDPFVGSSTGVAQPNYAVSFEASVP